MPPGIPRDETSLLIEATCEAVPTTARALSKYDDESADVYTCRARRFDMKKEAGFENYNTIAI